MLITGNGLAWLTKITRLNRRVIFKIGEGYNNCVFTKFITAVLIILIASSIGGYYLYNQQKIAQVNSFEDCVAAGYPVMESMPQKCRTPDGRNFTDKILVPPLQPEDISTSSGQLSTPDPNATPQPGGEKITIEGEVVCLPGKSQGGAQTMECAYGLKTADGKYYGLSDPTWKYLMGVGTSSKVKVNGTLRPAPSSKYDTAGNIEIISLTKI